MQRALDRRSRAKKAEAGRLEGEPAILSGAAARPSDSCGSPGAARARASMPSPGTKTGRPSRLQERAVALPRRHAGRLVLLLQAARRPARRRPGTGRRVGARRSSEPAPPRRRRCRQRPPRRTSIAPSQPASVMDAGAAEIDASSARAVTGRPGCDRSGRLEPTGGRDSCGARRAPLGQRIDAARAAARRSSRSTRRRGRRPTRRLRAARPAARCSAPRRRQRTPGGDVERVAAGDRVPGRPGATSARAAAASCAQRRGARRARPRRRERPPSGPARPRGAGGCGR